MIEVRNLQKQFGAVTALRNVSFLAPDGASTGLLGANGFGKSTTLRTICGVLPPGGGEVRVDGDSLGDDPLLSQRRVGALLDHAGLYSRLTPREIFTHSGRLHGIPWRRLGERVKEVITFLAMQSIADRRTGGFSQGERMKTALGRSLIHSPKNLLLDEPTNGLDVPSVRALAPTTAPNARCRSLHRILQPCIGGGPGAVRQGSGDRAGLGGGGTPAELCRRAGVSTLEDAFVVFTGTAEVL